MLHSFAGGTQSKEQKLYEASKAAAPLAGSAHTAPHTAAATTTAATARTITRSAVSRHDVPPIPHQANDVRKAAQLLALKADPNGHREHGATCLHAACQHTPELTRTPRCLRCVRTGYAVPAPRVVYVRTERAGRPAPRAPRTVRTGYAYQHRTLGTYRVPWHPRLPRGAPRPRAGRVLLVRGGAARLRVQQSGRRWRAARSLRSGQRAAPVCALPVRRPHQVQGQLRPAREAVHGRRRD